MKKEPNFWKSSGVKMPYKNILTHLIKYTDRNNFGNGDIHKLVKACELDEVSPTDENLKNIVNYFDELGFITVLDWEEFNYNGCFPYYINFEPMYYFINETDRLSGGK